MESSIVEVNWFGLSLLEPMTFFTDTLITVFCVLFWSQLRKKNERDSYWEAFFLLIGISTFLGGVAHLCFNYFGMNLHFFARAISGFAIYSAQFTTIKLVKSEKTQQFLRLFALIQLIVFLFSLFYFRAFIAVTINSVVGLFIFVLSMQLMEYFETKNQESKWIAVGIIIGLFAAVSSVIKFSPHQWFTHHDIGHFIMIMSLFFFYKGVKFRNESNENRVINNYISDRNE